MSDNKLISIVIVVFFIMVTILIMNEMHYANLKKDIIIKITPTPDIVILAMEYHGIREVMLGDEGFLYFIRDSRWCPLFNNGFRSWYVEKHGDDNGKN